MNDDSLKEVEQEILQQKVFPYYVEKIEKYNGTGDSVVIAPNHPVGSVMLYHSHTFFEINYVIKSDCLNLVEGQSLHMHSGDFIILHPEALHTLYSNRECSVFNILITIEWMENFAKRLGSSKHPLVQFLKNVSNSDALKYILFKRTPETDAIAKKLCYSENMPERALLREALLQELLCNLLTRDDNVILSEVLHISNTQMKKMISFMNAYFKTVDLDTLAENFHYTKSHVCKMFKMNTGKSFTANLNEIRIRRAQVFLAKSNKKVTQIAYECGYESIEYFHRLFKEHTGMTPLEYRESFQTPVKKSRKQ